jgi:hypothetical protein
MRRLALIALIALALLHDTASAQATPRFAGWVAGAATGAGHNFVVGDGLLLVFVDTKESDTPYRVCWHLVHHAQHRCWSGKTAAAGVKDRIFTAAPQAVGTYLVKWTIRHSRKATWRFSNGVGD